MLGAQTGRPDIGVGKMGAEKALPGVTRRVLLTTGGLTLLGIWAADPIRHITTATQTREAHHAHAEPGPRPSR
jgi:hypothetical protein